MWFHDKRMMVSNDPPPTQWAGCPGNSADITTSMSGAFTFSFPHFEPGGNPQSPSNLELDLEPSEVAVIVGRNGSGKSALVARIVSSSPEGKVQVAESHRRVWMSSSGSTFTSASRSQFETQIGNSQRDESSRWQNQFENQKLESVLFDLVNQDIAWHREYVKRIKNDDSKCAEKLGDRPVDKVNAVLTAGGLSVEIDLNEINEIVVTRETVADYGANRMSDGERAGFVLAALVLTAPESAVIVLDEPERHLHPAIAHLLVRAAIASRPDCSFMLLTHDLSLASTVEPRHIVAISDVQWNENGRAIAWEARKLPTDSDFPDVVRRAILGARRRILFVEGVGGSLDKPVYAALFPAWDVVPVGGASAVVAATNGISANTELHWLEVAGIIDGDGRTGKPASAGIYRLAHYSIEGLLLDPVMLDRVTESIQSQRKQTKDLSLPRSALFASVRSNLDSAVLLLTKQQLESDFRAQALDNSEVLGVGPVLRTAQPQSAAIRTNLEGLLDAKDQASVAKRVPMKPAGALKAVAKALDVTPRTLADAAVALLQGDEHLRDRVRSVAGLADLTELS